VGTQDKLIGCVTRQQLEQWRAAGRADDRVSAMIDGPGIHVHLDHPLDLVLERFAQTGGVLPVVSRTSASQVEGVITLETILKVVDRRQRPRDANAPAAAAVAVHEGTAAVAQPTMGPSSRE
jgi:predicted transcriptional regulator